MYDPTIGQWLSEDPLGFEAGDENLRRYVENSPTNFIDPTGLAKQNDWMIHLHDHGGAHIQLGDLRWDAVTLQPLKHKGVTPPPLNAKQLEELRQSHCWDKLVKDVPNTNLERAIRDQIEDEVYDEMMKKGTRRFNKKLAREIAEQVLRRTPAVFILIALSAEEVYGDCKKRGIGYAAANQIFPVDLIEEVASGVGDRYDKWSSSQSFLIWKNKFIRAGYSEEEAYDKAFEYMMQWQADKLR